MSRSPEDAVGGLLQGPVRIDRDHPSGQRRRQRAEPHRALVNADRRVTSGPLRGMVPGIGGATTGDDPGGGVEVHREVGDAPDSTAPCECQPPLDGRAYIPRGTPFEREAPAVREGAREPGVQERPDTAAPQRLRFLETRELEVNEVLLDAEQLCPGPELERRRGRLAIVRLDKAGPVGRPHEGAKEGRFPDAAWALEGDPRRLRAWGLRHTRGGAGGPITARPCRNHGLIQGPNRRAVPGDASDREAVAGPPKFYARVLAPGPRPPAPSAEGDPGPPVWVRLRLDVDPSELAMEVGASVPEGWHEWQVIPGPPRQMLVRLPGPNPIPPKTAAQGSGEPWRPILEAAEASVRHWRETPRREIPGLHRPLGIGTKTAVMGVVNVTPDSFSDGGQFLEPDRAVAHGLRLVAEGADLLDVGGESTRPGAGEVTDDAEWARLAPVLEGLRGRVTVPLSVDTRHASVAARALEAGADIVNDVSGLRDPAMRRVVARTGAPAIAMHMRGTPATMQADLTYGDVVGEVYDALVDAVTTAVADGIPADHLLIDPGLGFGKSAAQNLEILGRLGEFRSMGLPVVVGASRKSFLGWVLGASSPADRLEAGLAAAVLAAREGAAVVRTHDVAPTVRALALVDAVTRPREA